MKKITRMLACILAGVSIVSADAGEPIELLAFSMPDGGGGLKLATRRDSNDKWRSVGNFWTFLGSDFGAWGSGKRMHNVRLTQDNDGKWWIVFNPDAAGEVVAYTCSDDFVNWIPQEYRRAKSDYMKELPAGLTFSEFIETEVDGRKVKGTVTTADSELIEKLNGYVHYRQLDAAKNEERADQDAWRFKDLTPLQARVTLNPKEAKPITDKFIGIFFEDINYGADGGLYAELIQNRDFEYSERDRREWNATSYWETTGDSKLDIGTENPIHSNNAHYAVLTSGKKPGTLTNKGFDGITLKKGDKYIFSMLARSDVKTGMTISLTSPEGKILAKKNVNIPAGADWSKVETTLIPTENCPDATLSLQPSKAGTVNLDMISLFPEKTFRGHRNGLREDLAQTLADLHPRFMRFPGGCVSHGNGIDNIYDWKGSIGPLEARKPLPNLWGYHQTRGLGFYEYFQFCEDLGMEPLPVLAAGVPCQNSSWHSHCSVDELTSNGQQDGIPLEDMPAYIQDILDLVEYANGPSDSQWGSKRTEAGHPEPFNLKYLGIGNEDLISETFKTRFKMIKDAVEKKYPEITVVGTTGPFYEGSDYEEGWRFAKQEKVPIVDEHYYVAPGWYVNHRDFYDNYERNNTKVYLGEYASHYPGRESNLECALSIALYLTDVERNGDVVEMTSYAPLLSKKNRTQWRPDLIYFDNESITLSPDYWVQQMYGANPGTTYVPATTELSWIPMPTDTPHKYAAKSKTIGDDIKNRFGVSTVIDENTGDTIVRIANMLPTMIAVNLEGYPKGTAEKTTLTGTPRQLDAKPTTETIEINDEVMVPGYSFTIVRIKK